MSELFNIRLEHDLSEFDSVVTDGGDLSHGTPGLAGSSGKMVLVIDDAWVYGVKNFTPTGTFRARFYFDTSDLVLGSSDPQGFLGILYIYNSSGQWCGRVCINYQSESVDRIFLQGWDDNGAKIWGPDLRGVSRSEHYVEVCYRAGSGTNGTMDLWVDGVHIGQTTLDTDTRWADMCQVNFGAAIQNATGAFYLDEFKANNDGSEIGPLLTATGIACGAPVLDMPTLAQIHALVATAPTIGSPALGIPSLDYIPIERTYAVRAERRVFAVDQEIRTYTT